MLGLLYRIIIGHFTRCHHKWTTFSEMQVTRRDDPRPLETRPVAGTMYGLRCDHCGDITQRYVGLH